MYLFSNILSIYGGNLWEKLLTWYEQSAIKELLAYLESSVFHLSFGTYENFTVGSGTTLRNVILGLMLGMIFASGMMVYTRAVQGKFIRALLRESCHSPEQAKTLRELGMFRSVSVRRELAHGGVLSKLTCCASSNLEESPNSATLSAGTEACAEAPQPPETAAQNAGVPSVAQSADTPTAESSNVSAQAAALTKPSAPDFLTARYYIPADLKYRAGIRYRKNGSGVPFLILSIVLCVAAAYLLCRYLPALLGLADWIISSLAP